MKRLFLLFAVMLCIQGSVHVQAHDFKVDGIYYNIIGEKAVEVTFKGSYVSEYSQEYGSTVVIPASVTYDDVTYTVTTIGEDAFYDCMYTKSITIPNSITTIKSSAFAYCTRLEEIIIPNSVTSIEAWAFRKCLSLSSVILVDGITSISVGLFLECRNLKSIEIPESVTAIGGSAFQGTALTSIEIPEGVTAIGINAFYGCTGLTSVTIPQSVTSIGDKAFYGCTSLVDINLPQGITTIGTGFFEDCKSLSSVVLPDKLITIGRYAFSGAGITSIIIPESVDSIGTYAFYRCNDLEEIILPKRIKKIEPSTFRECENLKTVILNDSLISINYRAFSHCVALTSINIPKSVELIDPSAFSYCSALTSIHVNEDNPIYDSRDNCNAVIETRYNTLVLGCKNSVVPNSVTIIGNSAFASCVSLDTVTIPENVTEIGSSAFSGCSNLTSIKLPNSLITIASRAFAGCVSLDTVTIPENVTEIGSSAFSGCSNLKTIKLPNSIVTIGREVFAGCVSLEALTIPENVTEIGSQAFAGCVSLEALTIPENVTYIGIRAFRDCNALQWINSKPVTPPSLEWDDVFLSSNKSPQKHIPVFVPKGSLEAYRTADGWKLFDNIQEYSLIATSITIDTMNVSMRVAEKVQLAVDVKPDCVENKSVEWTTSNAEVATVEEGVVTAHSLGEATITATTMDGTNLSVACQVVVLPTMVESITLDQEVVNMNVTDTITLSAMIKPETATVKEVVWSSSDNEVASVEAGVITAHKVGSVTITASTTDGSNMSARCIVNVEPIIVEEIEIIPSNLIMEVTESQTLTALISPNTATTQDVEWSTNNGNIATVKDGVVTAHKVGETIIKARSTDGGGVSATCTVTVIPTLAESVVLNEDKIKTRRGGVFVLSATVLPEHTTDKSVEWSVSDADVIKIIMLDSYTAKVFVEHEGFATITVRATDGSDRTAVCEIDAQSGVIDVQLDNEDAEYYDLSGRRVEQPTRGVYIMRQGSIVRKVVL